ncbi:MAG TPA: hypothetical protein VMU41_12555 [Candidatus Binataceae bacterium]|nr:hypothetical protein [Candidatus Binataceae bacterium]
MRRAVLAIAALCLSSCASAAMLPAAGLVQSMGSTADSFWTMGTTTRLNGADADLATAQTRLTLGQYSQAATTQARTARERVVTARLLRQMAKTYNDPLLDTMAQWVEGGGDPDFSFKYALVQVSQINSEERQVAKQQSAALVIQSHTPKVKPLAQSPLSVTQLRG